MNEPPTSTDTGQARRMIVTLFIGTAAAAVTAGVGLNERHASEAAVQRAAPDRAVQDAGAGAPAASLRSRRAQWLDPWRRPDLTSGASTMATPDGPRAATVSSPDPSLPVARDALRLVGESSGEDAPTF